MIFVKMINLETLQRLQVITRRCSGKKNFLKYREILQDYYKSERIPLNIFVNARIFDKVACSQPEALL